MRLKVLLPTEVLIDEEATKITAEAKDGSFCLLPRHIDFLTALAPGILVFETSEAQERLLAVDEGILLKNGSEVLISTPRAVEGKNLGELRQTIQEHFLELDDFEKKARDAAMKLEANFIRRFMEL